MLLVKINNFIILLQQYTCRTTTLFTERAFTVACEKCTTGISSSSSRGVQYGNRKKPAVKQHLRHRHHVMAEKLDVIRGTL